MFKRTVAILLAGFALGVSAEQFKFDFSKDTAGQVPPGFESLVTGRGSPGPWKVTEEAVPPLLAPLEPDAPVNTTQRAVLTVQSFQPWPDHFPILLFTNEIFSDFSLVTRFKISGGVIEPAAGLVFRAQDQSNYYVLRASTDGNLLWFKVVAGQPYESLGIGVKVPIEKDVWRELRVDCQGSQIRCFLDGKLAIPPVRPGAPTADVAINDTTFSHGKVGYWTKADTKCFFVDGHVQYTPHVPYVQVVVGNMMRRYPKLLGLSVYASSGKTGGLPVIIGDMDEKGLGKPGTKTEQTVIEDAAIFYAKEGVKWVEITLPLRDRNGDVEAALKVRMRTFRGETQSTAVARAVIIKKAFEEQIETMQDINQ